MGESFRVREILNTLPFRWSGVVGTAESVCRGLLEHAGVTVGGHAPHDIVVHNPDFYHRILAEGVMGLGESYMDGWWDCDAIDQMVDRVTRAGLYRQHVIRSLPLVAHAVVARVTNLQSVARSFEVGRRHYDLGNDLYEAMLDRRMVYTCGYWRDAQNLDDAQEAKLDLVCRKLGLQKGMRVLELGCGWGSLAEYAASKYGVSVEGYTVSKEQVALGRERCQGLPVTLHLADYRSAEGKFDAVVSIGIMEHVGAKNYRGYMELADRCLVDDGIAFVHTIGIHRPQAAIDPFYHRYIFPNAQLPALSQLTAAADDLFVIEDVHNFGPYYDPTLMAWWHNFDAAWPELKKSPRYDERFYRMWKFYLLTCAGGFRSRTVQLFQLAMTKPGRAQPDCRLV